MYSRRYTQDRIESLENNEIFVFGSNARGLHTGGAARLARERFGAQNGQGEGIQGRSYAIPTARRTIEQIAEHVNTFLKYANEHDEKIFLVTRIGCNNAGFTAAQIGPLFQAAIDMENVILPRDFVDAITETISMPAYLKDRIYGQARTLVDIIKGLNKESGFSSSKEALKAAEDFVKEECARIDLHTLSLFVLEDLICKSFQNGHLNEESLDKAVMAFGELPSESANKAFKKYVIEKTLKLVEFLNEFRRYTSIKEIRQDLLVVLQNTEGHSGINGYGYFSINVIIANNIEHFFELGGDRLFKNGILDNSAIEDYMFGRYNRLGLKEIEKLAREQSSCGVFTSSHEFGYPIFLRDDTYGKNRRSCGCKNQSPTGFEFEYIKSIIANDPKYKFHGDEYYGFYIPIEDFSLPVYSINTGRLIFSSKSEKDKFIKEHQ